MPSIFSEISPALADVPVYQPGRPIEEVAREHGLPVASIIKLASNENPLGPSPKAVAAMRAVLDQLHLYPDGNAFYLKRRLAEKLGVAPENLIFGNGSNEIIEFVSHAFMRPGVDVIVSQYSFAVYPMMAKLFGANLISVPSRDFGHDLAAMRKAVTPQTRVLCVANPNNPTGTLAPKSEIEALVREVPENVLLVMDEAYIEFLDDAPDLIRFIREGVPNLVLMRTFSKVYGLAGLRLGYGIAHPQLIAAFEKVRQPFNVNAIAQAGALAALDDTDHLNATRNSNAAGLRYLAKEFQRLGLRHVPSAANFLLVQVGDGQRVFTEMQKQGVIVRPMAGYKVPEWIRITVGTPAENQKAIAALENALKSSSADLR